jgi:hypothetical protein
MWIFDRFTASGRGRRDGKYWRVIHDRLSVERWEREALLNVATKKAEEDYYSHTFADARYHNGYICNFILAYTAKPRRERSAITDELTGRVKDAPPVQVVGTEDDASVYNYNLIADQIRPSYGSLPAPRVDERLVGHDY